MLDVRFDFWPASFDCLFALMPSFLARLAGARIVGAGMTCARVTEDKFKFLFYVFALSNKKVCVQNIKINLTIDI